MKDSKNQAPTMNDVRRAQLETERARLTLSSLESLFQEHSQSLQNMKMRCGRLQEEARVFIQREFSSLTGNVAKLAETLIAGGVTAEHLKRLISTDRLPLDGFYSKLNLKEADELVLVKELDFERAAIEVLQKAIRLQKSTIDSLRREEIASLNRSRADEHTKLARAVLAAVDSLNSNPLVEQNRRLAEDLQEDEIELLKPGRFPRRILSTELRNWLSECVAARLIDAGEIRKA